MRGSEQVPTRWRISLLGSHLTLKKMTSKDPEIVLQPRAQRFLGRLLLAPFYATGEVPAGDTFVSADQLLAGMPFGGRSSPNLDEAALLFGQKDIARQFRLAGLPIRHRQQQFRSLDWTVPLESEGISVDLYEYLDQLLNPEAVLPLPRRLLYSEHDPVTAVCRTKLYSKLWQPQTLQRLTGHPSPAKWLDLAFRTIDRHSSRTPLQAREELLEISKKSGARRSIHLGEVLDDAWLTLGTHEYLDVLEQTVLQHGAHEHCPSLLCQLARAYQLRDRNDEALRLLNNNLRQDLGPQDVPLYEFVRAGILRATSDENGALQAFEWAGEHLQASVDIRLLALASRASLWCARAELSDSGDVEYFEALSCVQSLTQLVLDSLRRRHFGASVMRAIFEVTRVALSYELFRFRLSPGRRAELDLLLTEAVTLPLRLEDLIEVCDRTWQVVRGTSALSSESELMIAAENNLGAWELHLGLKHPAQRLLRLQNAHRRIGSASSRARMLGNAEWLGIALLNQAAVWAVDEAGVGTVREILHESYRAYASADKQHHFDGHAKASERYFRAASRIDVATGGRALERWQAATAQQQLERSSVTSAQDKD